MSKLSKSSKLEKLMRAAIAKSAKRPAQHPAQKKKKKGLKTGRGFSNPSGPGSSSRPSGMPGQQVGSVALNSQNTSTSRRRQVIEEDEYIGEIAGSVGFATTAFPINPGQQASFPWGSKVASLYEEYDFDFLEFYYTSEVSQYASQGQTGTIVLSADYDASDANPISKQQVEDTVPHTRPCLPSTPLVVLRLDCAQMRRNLGKYVRIGPALVGTDIKTYDSGNVFVTTQGQSGTGNIGELHVRYRCTLRVPILEAGEAATGPQALHVASPVGTVVIGSAPFEGTVQNYAGGGLSSTYLGPSEIQIEGLIVGQEYLFSTTLEGSEATLSGPLAISTNSGMSPSNFFEGDSISYVDAVTSAFSIDQHTWIADAATTVLQFASTTGAVNAAVDFIITSLGTLFSEKRRALHSARSKHKEIQSAAAREARVRSDMESACARLHRLESLLSGRSSPVGESKEDDEPLEKSVHIDRVSLRKLLDSM